MESFINTLQSQNPALYAIIIYACVISIGLTIGKIKVKGISLGFTGVLFVGILISYLGVSVDNKIMQLFKEFGLAIFVYAFGMQVGPGFFASIRKEGLRLNILALMVVILGAATAVAIHYITGTPLLTMIGILSGATTSTPALGAAQQTAKDIIVSNPSMISDFETMSSGYAVAYPFAVIGVIAAFVVSQKIMKIKLKTESRLHSWKQNLSTKSLNRYNVEITNPLLDGKKIKDLHELLPDVHFVISRYFHKNEIHTATQNITISLNDVLLIVCKKADFKIIKAFIGRVSELDIYEANGITTDARKRTIYITQKEAYSKPLSELNLMERFGVIIPSVSRAGVEFIPDNKTVLQFGDTVSAIGERQNLDALSNLFGNSKKKLETPHIAEMFIGILIGILIGLVPIYLPGVSMPIKLGLAGGPLIAGILISRFGDQLLGAKISMTNYISQPANLMIKELGLALFLASIGLFSGPAFFKSILNGDGLSWFCYGIIISFLPILIVAIIARIFFKLDFLEMCGMLSGAQTDPSAMTFAIEQTGSDSVAVSYASVYPFATFMRILVAQILLFLFI